MKFACPVCGQHITCDSASSGSQMECPTCFRKLVVPQPTAGESSKFILSAAQVPTKRPITEIAPPTEVAKPPPQWLPWVWTGATVLVLAAATLAIVKLGGGKRHAQETVVVLTNAVASKPASPPVPADPRWRLNLAGATIPDVPANGQIKGKSFKPDRATIQNGTLALRQGAGWPPDVGVTVLLPKRPAPDYAGKQFLIEPNYTGPTPRVVLRIKDEQQNELTQAVGAGYAMKLEFGPITGDKLPGRIYLCTPDEANSVVVGSFTAEIRKPGPPKPPKKPVPPPPATNTPAT